MTIPVRHLVVFLMLGACASRTAFAQPAAADEPRPKVTIYGTIVANTSASDHQLFQSDVPLWALLDTQRLVPASIGSQQPGSVDAASVSAFEATARQTRLGFRIDVPAGKSHWTPTGRIEVDFFGARPAVTSGAVFNQPRLFLGVISLEHTSGWSIVAGQDWAIFAPGNPASFAHFAVPLAAAGGNPWMRLPQVRVDKRARLGGTKALLVQAGILRPLGGGDAPIAGSVADAPVLSGERSGQPFYQGRVALTATSHGRPQALGVSGHYGREKTEPITLDTWGVALDGSVAIGAKLGLAGEIWRGSNLDTFQAGILQGVTQQRGVFTSIDAMGGWVEGSVFVSPAWTIHAGLGVDDPDDDGLGVLVSRAKNQIAWVNLMVAPHPHVTIAFEYNYFDTTFRTSAVTPARKGTGNHVDVAFVLTF